MSRTNPQLQAFIEDELARAPLLIDELLQQLADAPLRFPPNASTTERQAVLDAREALQRARPMMVRAFSQTLREQVTTTAEQQAAAVRGLSLAEADELSLSLVDEGEVAMDVALQRATVMIHSAAEYELRELGSYTSALVGDVHVAHDTNPLRPEAYARALAAAARAFPRPQAEQLALMHDCAMPLSQALRKAYAGAAGRLEDQGVTPAVHRTIVMPPGVVPPRGPSAPPPPPPADLHMLRDSMPVPFDMEPIGGPAVAPPAPMATPTARPAVDRPPAPPQATRVDHQLIELLTRLFDAILADRTLPPDVQRLLSRLHTSAVRVALRDPAMLDSYSHPVWEFMDRLVFDASRHAGEAGPREKYLAYTDSLVDHMVREPTQDAALYRWGIGRLDAFAEHLLGQHARASQSQIDHLRTLAMLRNSSAAAADTGSGHSQPLDIGTLDTVPAELIDLPAPSGHAAGASRPLPALQPGEWLHLFLQGEWRELQLLWTDGRGEAWLFRQPGGRTWALRRAALERLNDAGLAEPLEPPSLVQHAAQLVLRQVAPPPPRG
jgi:hypothetical protein